MHELNVKTTSASVVSCLIRGTDRSTIWNGTIFVSETTLTDAEAWQLLLIPCEEELLADDSPTGNYVADWPTSITINGQYSIEYYLDTPDPTDVPFDKQVVIISAGSVSVESTEEVLLTHVYGTVERGGVYLSEHKFDYATIWVGTDRQIAINQATQLIESLNFKDEKTDATQILEFPRDTDTIIPPAIEQACYEIAFALLGGKCIDLEADTKGQTQVRSVLGLNTIDPTYLTQARRHNIPSEIAWNLLKPFLRDVSSPRFERVS